MQTHTTLSQRLHRLVASRGFFGAIVGLLVLQAVWIALSGRYPMAFDEDFHLGIIKLYAHHLSPFWGSAAPGGGTFGAVARDPSYLFQYLMSFPYRLFSLFTRDQSVIVLLLRTINITLFASGVVLYRKVLLRTGVSRAIVHGCLAVFVLLPIVPLLAAQINYDNLLLPLFALTLLLVMRIHSQLKAGGLPLRDLLIFAVACLLTSIVKYAFLPLALGMVLYIIADLYHNRRQAAVSIAGLRSAARALSKRGAVVLTVLLLLASGLFVERYGVNLVRYHTPIPKCDQVLSVSECSAYGPWNRDYSLAAAKPRNADTNPVIYSGKWVYGMWLRTFFAVDGPKTGFQTRGPLAVPSITGAVVVIASVGAVAVSANALRRRRTVSYLGLFAVTTAVYIASLWREEYKEYVHTGQPVAINGRYLLIVAPLIMLAGAVGLAHLIGNRPRIKSAVLAAVIIAMLWGGGALTYILRSNDQWYWQNAAVRSANHALQQTVGPITPGYSRPLLFLH